MDRWHLYTTPLSSRSGRRSACSDVETDKQVPPVIARSAAGEASLLVPEHMDDPGWLSPCYLALCHIGNRRNTPPPLYRRLPPLRHGVD